MKFFIVRHGETDWNLENRIQGHTNVSLNNKGVKQAEALVSFCDGLSFAAMYSSGLNRAIETVKILTRGKKPLIHCPELNERNFGSWQTQLWADIHRQYPDLNEIWAT